MNSIVVLISGNGSNLQAILDQVAAGRIDGKVTAVISNVEDAYGLERARNADVPAIVLDHKAYDSRGRLADKRHITERPSSVEDREEVGHWEIDTVIGHGSKDCIVTLVERATGYLLIGKLPDRTTASLNKVTIKLIKNSPLPVKTITADNGTEFHQYKEIEKRTGTLFYFATPHHSWERGSNENANGLIRQYIPKRTSMKELTQEGCTAIERRLNSRPRKRYGFKSPWEMKNEHV